MAGSTAVLAASSESSVSSTPQTPSEEESSRTSSPPPAKPKAKAPGSSRISKYRHVAACHSVVRPSCLSRESDEPISFFGFRNLMVLVLIVMNLRLIIENFMKYGVLICVRCHDYRRQDVTLAAILLSLVPCHLFIAYLIELAAAQHVKRVIGKKKKEDDDNKNVEDRLAFRLAWFYIALAHTVNATLCLAVTSYAVYFYVNHPGIGTICELHAIVVWLKNCSYAFTNRDLRHALLHPSPDDNLPKIYSTCPYPQNITVKNLTYFWLAPTLVYQPVYPRTDRIRWNFVAKRVAEFSGLVVFMWIISAQYASPTLVNALEKVALREWAAIAERVMKLSTISLVIWLAGFYALFQSYLNALAEIMKFGDRQFYEDWWNSPSVGRYWRTWNIPVYQFMKRHIFSPLLGRGWTPFAASVMVFTFSAILHELAVGIPTHSITGVAFGGMMVQLPLIAATVPLEKLNNQAGKILGNTLFWLTFCLVGQPLAALLYFFAWQAKHGSLSTRVK